MSRSSRRIIVLIIGTALVTGLGIAWRLRVKGTSVRIPEASPRPDPIERSNGLPTLIGSNFLSNPKELDAAHDRWPSEAFADSAARVLDRIKTAVKREEMAVQEYFGTNFLAHVPAADPSPTFADETITVRRAEKGDGLTRLQGEHAARNFLRSILAADPGTDGQDLSIKIIHVELRKGHALTMLRAEANLNSAQRGFQTRSEWTCDWILESNSPPKIASAELAWLETVERKGEAWFVDRTRSVIGHTKAFQDQISHGLQHWLERIETSHGMNYFSKHGLAVGDVNGDRLEDLYVCQPGGIPNRLFLQNADGTSTDRSREYGVDVLDRTSSALLVDLDNDGDQDLALATLMGVQIFENVESRAFEHRRGIEFPDSDLQGLSAADYDNDGDLDLYQLVDYASEGSRVRQGLPAFVYHNANDGGANHLLRNELQRGKLNWEFTDVTNQVGLHVNNQRHSLAAAWEDFDNDGDQDLYVANDYGQNCLYRNDGGRFVDVAHETGVTDFGSGMSVSWGDYDRDGQMDLYVGNMFSSAGGRLTAQPQFLPNVSQSGRELYQRFAKGNSLYRNAANGRFEDVGATARVEMGRWAWSSLFADVNNDAWDDLLVANGYITTFDPGDL
jgi:hypothetical protein